VTEIFPELDQRIREDVRNALAEDLGSGDLSAQLVPEQQQVHARVLLRDEAVICGQAWFDEVFRQLAVEISINWSVSEGDLVHADTYICDIQGPARAILSGERSALNFLQTLSATATSARAFSIAVQGTGATILDTRKTLPGLRLAQKYAVQVGGASNHRIGLFDAIMIKENHIVACGGIRPAVDAAREQSASLLVIVEVENLDEASEAMRAQADRLLLDDFSIDELRHAVAMRAATAPEIKLEASGGVTIDKVQEIADAGVDFISVGSLTKHIRAADLSMRFDFQN